HEALDPVPMCDPLSGTIAPRQVTLRVGDTVTFRASGPIARCDAPPIAAPAWRWRSSDARVATIDSSSGLSTARGSGQTTVIATLVQDANVAVAAAITVAP
ncbi:MAG TPA: Ig-like domain-containing protein, partial [Gemmatimonadaceae bacterium]|nr:Ig-like domain-containing protein [Gemmatimonadaceae bacterium]